MVWKLLTVLCLAISPAVVLAQSDTDALRLEILKCRMDLLTAPIEERYTKLKSEYDALLQKFQTEMKAKADKEKK